ncbi:hypothetical protein [Streptomyces sp. NRRL S-920]|uniref:hypothetical protein n=1 Tax=Streptomyces sp. NRRL S-920 TaxID=1463921 RepID=UPI001F40B1AF|nr:hypothetical protein [Streptomyces sp. NRRL S-920]
MTAPSNTPDTRRAWRSSDGPSVRRTGGPPVRRAGGPPAPRRRPWPDWAPLAAQVWGALYAAVIGGWAVTGTAVPLRAHTYQPVALLLAQAALAVLAAGVCAVAATGDRSRRGRKAAGGLLALLIPAFGWGAIGLPIHFVTLASGSGVESATGLVHTLLNTCGAGLLSMVAVAHRRRLRGRCARCGQAHDGPGEGRWTALTHPPASTASARTRVTAYVLLCGLLPWAVVKTVWLFGGDAIGVSGAAWRHDVETEATGASRALASVGVDVSVLAALLGVFLLAGLMYRWGQVFPRWTPLLAGRRVPRLLPLIPAWLTGGALSVYGTGLLVYALLSAVGVVPGLEPVGVFTTTEGMAWMVAFGGMSFGGLGAGLLVAARSYATRSRPVCADADCRETGGS